VAGLLRQIFLTDEDGLLEIAGLPVFIRERREITSRILVEFLSEFVDSGGTCSQLLPSLRTRGEWAEARDRTNADYTQMRRGESIRSHTIT
jgi:O-succinylbenzoate synthase